MSLIRAVRDKDVASVRRLLESPSGKRVINDLDETGLAPVHYAVRASDLDIVRVLHGAGADLKLDSKLTDGFTQASPLHLAAASGSLSMIDFLLDNGAEIEKMSPYLDPFGADTSGHVTPLLVAAHTGQFRAALRLLNRGAEPRHVDDFNRSLLHHCLLGDLPNDPETASDDLLAVMRAAVDGGVRPNHRGSFGINVEGYSFHTVDGFYVIDLAAVLNKPRMVSFLAGAGARLNTVDMFGNSPLHSATSYGSVQAFQALLEAGADLSTVGRSGDCVLHERGHVYGNPEDRYRIYELAIAAGLDIDTRNNNEKCSPLAYNAKEGRAANVRFFIDHGADLHAPAIHDFTPAHLAALYAHGEVLQLLIDARCDLKARCAGGTVLELTKRSHAVERPEESPDQTEKRLTGFEKIMSILVAAGERDWSLIPTPCRGLHRALPAVLQEETASTDEDLFCLFDRLVPEIQGRVRTALLLLNRFSPANTSTVDLRLPLLEAVLKMEEDA